ncbi:MAG: hypothetical protein J1G04_02520 [Clostridiales bacterium]|nr:hypothetical protein [Clostridiales bacterium]
MKDFSFSLKRKAVIATVCSAVFFVGVAVGYIPKLHRCYEMTFLSNTFAATVLLCGAVRMAFFGKDIPHFLYLCAATLLAVVVGICVSFAPVATLCSPSVMLHLVNPVIMFAFYMSMCDARVVKNRVAFTALILPCAYYLFMIVFGRITGEYIYPYFDPNRFTPTLLVVFGIVAGCVTYVVSRLLMALSRRVHNKRLKSQELASEEE